MSAALQRVNARKMEDIADFLRRHPPFDALDEGTLARAEPELHAAAAAILESADATAEHAYVLRRGSVELLIDGRLFDVLGEGEMFGFASLLEEGPLGFVARAAEDVLVYRIPADAIRPVLERPEAVRFVARTLSAGMRLLAGAARETLDPGGRPVGELIRAPAVVCTPDTSVGGAARRMVDAGATCVVVELRDRLGIVTDRDIRTRVLAEGAGPDVPLAQVMTAPAWTIAADRSGTQALLEMLDHGIRHLLVLAAGRRLLGVLDDVDLMASERRAPFRLRALIARGADREAVAAAASELPRILIALHDAGAPAGAIGRMLASLHDSITRRLIELAHAELGTPPVPYTWLATGSFGRREPFPSSDVDCALAWDGPDDDRELRTRMEALARRVLEGLSACRLHPDRKGAVASSPLFARSISAWRDAARSWAQDPDRGRGLILLSVVVESDPVWGATRAPEALAEAFARTPDRERMLGRLAAAALAERPPTGFLRQFVLHSDGQRRRVLEIKRGGLLPIEALARWSGLAAGMTAASTRARLDASRAAGTLNAADAAILREAFELVCALRMKHQVEQLRAGDEPDDLIDPKDLTPLTRSALKDAFRAVARVQRGIAVQRGLSPR
jgi:CBS domain-containing protein